MSTLESAIALAARAHAGQVDKAGAPYILHPLRMMFALRDPVARIVAVLHDVVEDTPVTLDALRAEGFSDEVVDAVDHLTRREGEDYFDFVRRASRHPVAAMVKRADLVDNSDTTRLGQVGDKDAARLERYAKALRILDGIDE